MAAPVPLGVLADAALGRGADARTVHVRKATRAEPRQQAVV